MIFRKKFFNVEIKEVSGRWSERKANDWYVRMKKHNKGAANWGFVPGKTGTVWPWSSRQDTATRKPASLNATRAAGEVLQPGDSFPEPEIWFHDLYRTDGTPYDPQEIAVFKELTRKQTDKK